MKFPHMRRGLPRQSSVRPWEERTRRTSLPPLPSLPSLPCLVLIITDTVASITLEDDLESTISTDRRDICQTVLSYFWRRQRRQGKTSQFLSRGLINVVYYVIWIVIKTSLLPIIYHVIAMVISTWFTSITLAIWKEDYIVFINFYLVCLLTIYYVISVEINTWFTLITPAIRQV